MHLEQYATLPLVSRILVAVGYLGFFALFVFKKQPHEREAKREPASILGIALQMVAFTLVWLIQRPIPRAAAPMGAGEIGLDVLAPVFSLVSAWLGLSALRTLGRQWSYAARLIEGHKLVTEGPYRLVRHPIYTAMLGMLLATNFAFGHWVGLLAAGAVFVIGTMIRIRSEEKLLRQAFGPEYEDYARRVKAFIPFVL
jgi:isoprenylcysteine carboxyl methyltransferase (ICMT) family protein YpbQ